MKDHTTWRPFWFYSEYRELQAIDRGQYRHALAAFLGALTVVLIAVAVYIVSG